MKNSFLARLFYCQLSILCFVILCSYNGMAQRCGFDAIRGKTQPEQVQASELNIRQIRQNLNLVNKTNTNIQLEMPVVIHVIHDNGAENISNEQAISQITELNRSFENLALPNGNTLSIHFFLAKCSPEGDSTQQGIIRVQSPYTVHGPGAEGSSEEQLKRLSYWNSRRYLNIWTVRSLQGSILGYTQYIQSLSNDTLDGVVVAAKYFGTVGNLTAPYNEGKTTVHEVGHYLGLYHPFDNSCSGALADNCEIEGDMVCDTPPSSSPTYGCPSSKNTCVEFPVDLPDLINNYMQYTDDRCMNSFTPGQTERMLNLIYGYRTELISDNNIARTNCLPVSRAHALKKSPSFSIHPNPFVDKLKLASDITIDSGTLELFDNWGRVVYAQPFTHTSYPTFIVDNIPPGVYCAKIQTSKGSSILKVIKLHN